MKTEYIAQFQTAEQYSPDDWKAVHPTLKITEETTIGEIRKWMAEDRRGSPVKEFKVIIVDVLK
jgi:hypothetical protein